MKIFFDTNVLISAYYFDGNERKILSKIIDSDHKPVVSIQVIEETKSVMNNKFNEDKENIEDFIERILAEFTLVGDHSSEVDIKDKADKKIIGFSIKSHCDYLVTGDKLILECKIEDIGVMNSRELLKILRKDM